MAMHEFEYAATDAVLLLDCGTDRSLDVRSMIHTIAEYTNSWDASFPHFHMLDALLRHRYTYAIDVEQHPDYSTHKAYFDRLTGIEKICCHPNQKWNETTNPEVAVFCHPAEAWPANEPDAQKCPLYSELYGLRKIYIDAGSELWGRLVATGHFTGIDAVSPANIDLFDVIQIVVEEAQKREHKQAISEWYCLVYLGLIRDKNADYAAAQNDRRLRRIREVASQNHAYECNLDYGYTRIPSEQDLTEGSESAGGKDGGYEKFVRWWYAPVLAWYRQRVGDIGKLRAEIAEDFSRGRQNFVTAMRYVQQVMPVKSWKKIDAMVRAANGNCAVWSLETAQGLGAPEEDLAKLKPVQHDVDVCLRYSRAMYAIALRNCEKALALVPNDPWTVHMRGLVHSELREWSEAKPDLEAALAASPNDVKLLIRCAACCLGLEDTVSARVYVERFIPLQSEYKSVDAVFADLIEFL